MAERVRHVIGCMTGTSLDGLDAALVRITGTGLEMKPEFVGMVSHPLGDLAEALRPMANGTAHPPIDFLRAARKLGELHAWACAELRQRHTDVTVDFIVAHGQTIWHAPRDTQGHLSWQLFDPWPIVRQLGVPVCYDLRQADLIAGGEGAPITPIADWVMYRHPSWRRGVANLGGVCNVTVIDVEKAATGIAAQDLCPCNLLLDGFTSRLFPGVPFDVNGERAASGRPHAKFASTLRKVSPFYLRADGGSTGREDFSPRILDAILQEVIQFMSPNDVLASAVQYVCDEIETWAVSCKVREVIIAGGGGKNCHLMQRLKSLKNTTVNSSDFVGIPVDAREAMAFAVLGALAQDGVAITLPQVTGRDDGGPVRAGAWVYP